MLQIIKPTLMSMLHPYVSSCLTQDYYVTSICPDVIFQILLPCSRPMMSCHVICHVTAMSHASLLSKEKKEKTKQN